MNHIVILMLNRVKTFAYGYKRKDSLIVYGSRIGGK
jgi:hypothetical protein